MRWISRQCRRNSSDRGSRYTEESLFGVVHLHLHIICVYKMTVSVSVGVSVSPFHKLFFILPIYIEYSELRVKILLKYY